MWVMLDRPAYLGVARSVTGRRWTGPDAAEERLGEAISQMTGQPALVGLVMARRGVAPEAAEAYLAPTLRALMPDPSVLRDLDRAAERLADAVQARARIALFGDYDVDGAASVALVAGWLSALGLAPTVYIPHRIDEGYGPNTPAMTALGRAHDLVLCLDCGSATPEPIAAARAAGAEVLVVDHHLADTVPEAAAAVVNPNQAGCDSGLGHLCAAGVALLVLAAANRALRGRGAFRARPEPDLRRSLDLVALATIADVAPLTGLNRAFVRQGLTVLAGRARPGLAALADVAGLTAPPTARDLAFALAPRINAGGRIGDGDLGARLLSTACPDEAAALAGRLDALNRDRREIEAEVLAAAEAEAERRGTGGALVWAAGEGWHPGVLGIVASRLKERYGRPAVVVGLAGGAGKGSGRSVPGVDLGSAVAALAREGRLLKGGGHAMAAGLSVAADALPEAMAALAERLAAQGAGASGPEDLAIDGALAPGGAGLDLVAALEAAGPYGAANPAPRLALPGVRVAGLRTVGTAHLACRLEGAGGRVDAIAFRAEGAPLGGALRAAAETKHAVHAAGRLEIDDWGGRRRSKLRIEDLAVPGPV